jgi:hypothetical protein
MTFTISDFTLGIASTILAIILLIIGFGVISAIKQSIAKKKRTYTYPVAIGATVYDIAFYRGVNELSIKTIITTKNGIFFEWELINGTYSNVKGFPDYEIGKTVFLTRKGAEIALEKNKEGNDE